MQASSAKNTCAHQTQICHDFQPVRVFTKVDISHMGGFKAGNDNTQLVNAVAAFSFHTSKIETSTERTGTLSLI